MATKTTKEVIPTSDKKPTRGRGGTGNFPASTAGLTDTDEKRQAVSKLLREVLTEYRQEKVHSDEELAARFDDYFRRCAESGQIPTVEEMCMATGYSYAYLWDIENGRRRGFSDSTADVLKKARDFLRTMDAKLVVTGEMNFLAYCFRAKNYYGMSDKQELVLTPNQQEAPDIEAIKNRYMEQENAMLPEASDS